MLKSFGTGWQNKFEKRLNAMLELLPDVSITSIERFRGMLRITAKALDNEVQHIVDSVTYKIERESVNTCEECGIHGIRRDAHIPEMMCLCWKCYALKIDSLQRNTADE
jgi:hypothetical protein